MVQTKIEFEWLAKRIDRFYDLSDKTFIQIEAKLKFLSITKVIQSQRKMHC